MYLRKISLRSAKVVIFHDFWLSAEAKTACLQKNEILWTNNLYFSIFFCIFVGLI